MPVRGGIGWSIDGSDERASNQSRLGSHTGPRMASIGACVCAWCFQAARRRRLYQNRAHESPNASCRPNIRNRRAGPNRGLRLGVTRIDQMQLRASHLDSIGPRTSPHAPSSDRWRRSIQSALESISVGPRYSRWARAITGCVADRERLASLAAVDPRPVHSPLLRSSWTETHRALHRLIFPFLTP